MDKHITIMDGGMGRELERIGAPFRRPEWSALALMEAPEYVSQAHDSYINAGAEIIITNSYAVVPFHIGQDRFDKDGRHLINLSGKLARQCADKADRKILVAGSIPPAFGSYRADLYIEDQADDIYTPLIEEQNAYIDFWLAETISTTLEIKKIASLLEKNNKPLWVAYTVRDRQGSDMPPQLRSGETIEEAVQTSLSVNAETILFNCSQPEEMEPVLEIINKMNTNIPYGVYANAFGPITRDQNASSDDVIIRDDAGPEAYLKFAQKWKNQGATIIGGCCGIGPEHIKELAKLNNT